MAAFPDIKKIPFEGPESKNPLAFRHYNANELVEGKLDEGPSPLQRGLLAHHARHGQRSVRARHHASPLGGGHGLGGKRHQPGRRGLRVHREARRPFFCFHDRDVAPEGNTLARDQPQPRRGGQGPQGGA